MANLLKLWTSLRCLAATRWLKSIVAQANHVYVCMPHVESFESDSGVQVSWWL